MQYSHNSTQCQQQHAWQAFRDLTLNSEENPHHCLATQWPESPTPQPGYVKRTGQVIEHWIERLILRIFCAHHILTMCPPLAGWECSRGFISKLLQGFIGKKFGGWQHSFCQWYLFYFSHCFQHPHIAVHLKRVGPMPMIPSLNLSFYCGESYSTTDTKATSSCTALNLAWPSFHPGFVSYTTCHIPCSATLLSLGMRRKVPCHAGSGRLPIPHTFCYSTCNCLKC